MNGFDQLFGSWQGRPPRQCRDLASIPPPKAQYTARTVPLPPQLFSHNDQQVEWQSSLADRRSPDRLGRPRRRLDERVQHRTRRSRCRSASNGQNSFQVGRNVSQYSVGHHRRDRDSTGLPASTGTSVAGVRTKRGQRSPRFPPRQPLPKPPSRHRRPARSPSSALLSTILSTGTTARNSAFPNTDGAFSTSNLAQQLAHHRPADRRPQPLGLKRQIFFARIGGWDLHDNQVDNGQPAIGAHANLLRRRLAIR
jgi:hypothetical protein